MKYFLYTRKSTEDEERQVLSLQSQLEKCQEIFGNLDIIELPPESASAFKPDNRPIFEDMIERIDRGEAHGIIAWHPDRLSRNEIDAADITYRIRTGKILDLKFGSYTFDNSPEGIMMLQTVMSHSQYFSAKLSKDVKRGNEKKLKMGWKPGVAPPGYLNTPDKDKGQRVIVVDSERFRLVRKMWDLMLTGDYTVPEIMKIANDEWGYRSRKTKKTGGGLLTRTTLYSIFTQPFYTGLIRHNGELHDGSHKPMITLAEYDRVQEILGRKGKPRPKKHYFTYRGKIFCGECGSAVTAEAKHRYIKSTGETHTYTYYHCTHKKPCSQRGSITEAELETQIDEYLTRITILPEFRDWALDVLQSTNDSEIEDRTKIHESQTRALLSAQKQLDNLTKMRLRDLLSDEEYIEQKETLVAEVRKLKEQLRDTEERADKWLELTEQTFDFASTARDRFANGDAQTKLDIFSALGENFVLKDNQLQFEPSKWFVPIEKNYPAIEAEYQKVRTRKFGSIKQKEAAFAAIKSSWLRGPGSNRQPTR